MGRAINMFPNGEVLEVEMGSLYLPLFEINHHFIFNILVYGILLAIWLKWVNKKGKKIQSLSMY
jgi:hypothetical protein